MLPISRSISTTASFLTLLNGEALALQPARASGEGHRQMTSVTPSIRIEGGSAIVQLRWSESRWGLPHRVPTPFLECRVYALRCDQACPSRGEVRQVVEELRA